MKTWSRYIQNGMDTAKKKYNGVNEYNGVNDDPVS